MDLVDEGAGVLTVSIGDCPPLERLGQMWRELEIRSDASFFLRWHWIGAWIEAMGMPTGQVLVRRGDEIVGLALIHRSPDRWFGPLRRPALWLHEAGDPRLRSVAIEYNGVLADRTVSSSVEEACLRALAGLRQGDPLSWRAMTLGGVAVEWETRCRRLGLKHRVHRRQPAPYARLDSARDALEGVSRNTRSQIRRSMRLYQSRGGLTLRPATTIDEARKMFDGLEQLHTSYWRSRGQGGAFAEPSFRRLHDRLLATAFPDGGADLLEVQAGSGIVGYLYNFICGGVVYAYQSGFLYEADARLKPGLVCHALAMNHYRHRGMRLYRFLAGDSRYKTSLADGGDELVWLTCRHDDIAYRAETAGRALLGRLRNWAKGHGGGGSSEH
ncbi:GNAT family N-acetyltransferase [Magnetospirillum molischianum]|uniref:GNAT family N-acetyltransferase n=1 Tax=Magnetospirillum molischianum TaxID=1083 RepID=UPI001F2C30EA|nr:GNAT family N-acetyltransferase [Magnetospirillum molischianum]